MKTQKEIHKEIKELQEKLSKLENSEELRQIEKERRDKVSAFWEKIRPERDSFIVKIDALKEQLFKIKEAKASIISQRLQKWLEEYIIGVDFGPQGLKIKEILDAEERFVLIHNPGHAYWSGRGEFRYGSTTYWIEDTFITKRWTGRSVRIGSEVEGRLTKEAKKKLLEELEEYKKKNKI